MSASGSALAIRSNTASATSRGNRSDATDTPSRWTDSKQRPRSKSRASSGSLRSNAAARSPLFAWRNCNSYPATLRATSASGSGAQAARISAALIVRSSRPPHCGQTAMPAIVGPVMSDVFDKSIRDPEQIASLFKTEVMGSLPMVKSWHRRLAPALTNEAGTTALVPVDGSESEGRKHAVTGFEEAIRTLRNPILLGNFDRRLKSLMITSATPAEGKTTTAVHLAIAHAQQKHKTLLIDCDMRRPGVHGKL